jgi:NAD(P)-dependent dehydrogenase (short-subunit alcohol dehydrogenase family)
VALAQHGAHVVALARTQGGLEEVDDAIRAQGRAATLLPLDLKDGEQVDAIGPSLFQRFGRLDVLVHCAAALGRLTPVPHITMQDWDDAAGVNLQASLRLIRTCEPLLRQAPAGRAVFVTDGRAREPLAYWGAYGATKAAMEHLVLTWAQELRITRVRANLFDPGVFRSRLRSAAFPGEDPASLPGPEDVAPALVALCLPAEARSGELVQADPGRSRLPG